jgi:hypothetical protein
MKSQLSTSARVQDYWKIVSTPYPYYGPITKHLQSTNYAENKVQPQPSRKSLRLQKIRDLNQQRGEETRKRTRSSRRTTKTRHCIGQEQRPADCGISSAPRNCRLRPSLPHCCTMLTHTLSSRSKHNCPNKRCTRRHLGQLGLHFRKRLASIIILERTGVLQRCFSICVHPIDGSVGTPMSFGVGDCELGLSNSAHSTLNKHLSG